MEDRRESRREIVKKVAYVAPAVLTLAATPSLARGGSGTTTRTDNHPDGRQVRRIGQ